MLTTIVLLYAFLFLSLACIIKNVLLNAIHNKRRKISYIRNVVLAFITGCILTGILIQVNKQTEYTSVTNYLSQNWSIITYVPLLVLLISGLLMPLNIIIILFDGLFIQKIFFSITKMTQEDRNRIFEDDGNFVFFYSYLITCCYFGVPILMFIITS